MITFRINKILDLADGKGMLQVDTALAHRSFTALYGPSGAGKTTILRILAGLLNPEEGYIEVDGNVWLDIRKGINLTPQKREIGFVFQDHALFPNMTVRQNLHYALPKGTDKKQADDMLDLIGLQQLSDQRPHNLSGGQKQRVALARALVRQPKLLLLDEPFSALGDAMRNDLHIQLQKIHDQLGTTTIMASHNIPEICRLAQTVINIEDGQMIRSGAPAEVFDLQRTAGELTGSVVAIDNGVAQVLIGNNMVSIPITDALLTIGDQVTLHTADLSFKKLS
jgi:molybdate transport system ATP-binding protein